MTRELARAIGWRLVEWADRPIAREASILWLLRRLRTAQRDGGIYLGKVERPDGSEEAVVRAGGRELRLVIGRPTGDE